jgi:Holliday junction DNA helicase RuvA
MNASWHDGKNNMIGRLRGILLEKHPPEILIECAGIGYEVLLPLSAFSHLPETGKELVLYTHFVVREDAQLLFGFASRDDRALFRELLRVNGVGPKLALAVLSGLSRDELLRCVHEGDLKQLSRVPGIGKKTAERLVIELRDRLKDFDAPSVLQPGTTVTGNNATQEAVSALVALGYKPQDASRIVAQAENQLEGKTANPEELIRLALRLMAK